MCLIAFHVQTNMADSNYSQRGLTHTHVFPQIPEVLSPTLWHRFHILVVVVAVVVVFVRPWFHKLLIKQGDLFISQNLGACGGCFEYFVDRPVSYLPHVLLSQAHMVGCLAACLVSAEWPNLTRLSGMPWAVFRYCPSLGPHLGFIKNPPPVYRT